MQYTVVRGDTLSSIAKKFGIPSWSTIYNHPQNGGFRAKRPNPNIIHPGDLLFIPVGHSPQVPNATGDVLQLGSRGPEVETAQAALNYFAHDDAPQLHVSGVFDDATHRRTVEFQTENGLVPDGKIGRRTKRVLFAYLTVDLSFCVMFSPGSSNTRDSTSLAVNQSSQPSRIDWSKIPTWPPPPPPTTSWPPLQLTFPWPPQLPGSPPPSRPRLVFNRRINQGQMFHFGNPGAGSSPIVQFWALRSIYAPRATIVNLNLPPNVSQYNAQSNSVNASGSAIVAKVDGGTVLPCEFYLKAKAEQEFADLPELKNQIKVLPGVKCKVKVGGLDLLLDVYGTVATAKQDSVEAKVKSFTLDVSLLRW